MLAAQLEATEDRWSQFGKQGYVLPLWNGGRSLSNSVLVLLT